MSNLKEESLELKKKNIKNYTNKRLYVFLIVSCVLYVFFFSTNFIFPPTFRGVEVLSPGEKVEAEGRTLTLLSWVYSEKEKKMEALLMIDNLSLDGLEKYTWEIRDKDSNKKVDIVLERNNLVVLDIYDIKKDYTELKLTMSKRDEDKKVSSTFRELYFYTSKKVIRNVDHISKKTYEEYLNDASNTLIDGYKKEIKKLEKEIEDKQLKIGKAKEKINEIEKEEKYMTESEKKEAAEKILGISDKKKEYEDEKSECEKKVKELNKKIKLKEKEISEGKENE